MAMMKKRASLGRTLQDLTRKLATNSESTSIWEGNGAPPVKPYKAIPQKSRISEFFSALDLLFPGKVSRALLKYFEKKYPITNSSIYRSNVNLNFEIVVIENPQDSETVLRNEDKYPYRLSILPLSSFRQKWKKPAGVFFGHGEEWLKHRSVISKKMLRPKELSSYSDDVNRIIDDFITYIRLIREPAGTEREFEVVDIDKALLRLSFENVANFVYGKRFGSLEEPVVDPRVNQFIHSVVEVLSTIEDVTRLPMLVYKLYQTETFKRFNNGLSTLYECVERFLDEALNRMNVDQAGRQNSQEGQVKFLEYLLMSGKLEVEDLTASIVDLLFAGIDTSANTLHWSLYLLGKNPEKMKKLEDELHSVLKSGEVLNLENARETPFLKSVVKETLRLYPVLNPLPRKIPRDLVLSGYHIPAGTQVVMNFRSMSHNPKFFPNPEVFYPERWFDATSEQTKFASLPFGFGVRMCVGRRFAELQIHLLLARLMQEFRLEYPSGKVIKTKVRGFPVPSENVRIKFYDRY